MRGLGRRKQQPLQSRVIQIHEQRSGNSRHLRSLQAIPGRRGGHLKALGNRAHLEPDLPGETQQLSDRTHGKPLVGHRILRKIREDAIGSVSVISRTASARCPLTGERGPHVETDRLARDSVINSLRIK